MLKFKLDTSNLKFNEYFDTFHKVGIKSMETAGLIGMHNMAVGAGNINLAPPIDTNRLRGSASTFVEGVFVGDTSSQYENGTPAKTGAEKKKWVVTWTFNTPYAARWHEEPFNPGPVSLVYGNVGNKYVERHLDEDKELIVSIFAKEQRKNVR